MIRRTSSFTLLALLVASTAFAQWESVGPGVDYREFREGTLHAHVARIDLRDDRIRLIASSESEKGMRTSDWAEQKETIVAINADYFDENHDPVGLAFGPCGIWDGTSDTRREGVVAAGLARVEIREQADVMNPIPEWVEQAVSGWPLIIADCQPFSSSRLPGSDGFTRSPHPRTAVGVSGDGRYLYFVAADGRREGVPGLTLAELADFMYEELDVCRALNLDGGGSTTMVIGDRIMNRPSDGQERWVANHIGVVRRSDYRGCETE
ncbi:MAG: phosphodiester glycosidase family protein [Thermoanaerobaculia bacterium]